jgi:hypothetical protein
MILNGSFHVFLNLKKTKQQTIPKNDPTALVNIAFQCSIAHHIALNEVQ